MTAKSFDRVQLDKCPCSTTSTGSGRVLWKALGEVGHPEWVLKFLHGPRYEAGVKPPANGRSEQPCRLALLKNPPDPNSLGILNRPLPQLEHRSLLNPSLTSYALGRNG